MIRHDHPRKPAQIASQLHFPHDVNKQSRGKKVSEYRRAIIDHCRNKILS
jgi:hypothetical protein